MYGSILQIWPICFVYFKNCDSIITNPNKIKILEPIQLETLLVIIIYLQ